MASAQTARYERAAMFEVQRPFSPVQWAAVVGAIVVLVWSVPGLIVNPDFSIGDSASAERVLGVDMNGWHALSGFFVAVPALLLASRPYPAALFELAAAASLVATGIWALLDTQIAGGLFYFPNNATDALLHFATSTIFLAGAAHYFSIERTRPGELSRRTWPSASRGTR
jgi:hypothetical protein